MYRHLILNRAISGAIFFVFSAYFIFALSELGMGVSVLRSFSGVRFFVFLWHSVTWQLGFSSVFQESISDFFVSYIWISLLLGFCSLLTAFFCGLFLSYIALKRPRIGKWAQVLGLGTPITVWAIIINQLLWSSGDQKGHSIALSFFLGLLTATIYHSIAIFQMSWFFFQQESCKPYYQLLLKGHSRKKIFLSYLLKPNWIIILDNLGLKICILLGGSVGIENFFHLPGMGFLIRKSIIHKDEFLLLASSFYVLLWISVAYLILNIVIASIDYQQKRERKQ